MVSGLVHCAVAVAQSGVGVGPRDAGSDGVVAGKAADLDVAAVGPGSGGCERALAAVKLEHG
jgi:hypothetical protein